MSNCRIELLFKKKYDNLLTVDLVCHGVPSPGVWRKYLRDQILNKDQSRISNIQFRDKRLGWKTLVLLYGDIPILIKTCQQYY